MTRPTVAALVACLLALACALPASVTAKAAASAPGDLLVLSADGGTLVPAKGAGRFVLTLRGADRNVTWFTDRPARHAGTVHLRDLVRGWARFGFVADPPNGAIELVDGASSADTVAVELGRPRYDAAAGTLRFAVRRLPSTVAAGAHTTGVDTRLPRRFGRVSVFVDDLAMRQVGLRVVNASDQPVAIAEGLLTGGVWQSEPIPGMTVAPAQSAEWVNGSMNLFTALGGQLMLVSATGGSIMLTWSWTFGGMINQGLTTSGLTGLAVSHATTGLGTVSPVVTVTVSDARSAG